MSAEWQSDQPRGGAVSLAAARAIAGGPSLTIRPVRDEIDGTVVVAYRSTRLHFVREAWEMVANEPGAVLVVQVEARDEPRRTYAFTHQELETVFGRVKDTGSWRDAREYHFPKLPPAAASYRVALPAGTPPPTPRPVRTHSADAGTASGTAPRRPTVTRNLRRPPEGITRDNWVRDVNLQLGFEPESPRFLEALEDWRNAWRPERVRVLLIAESHVTEQPGDAAVEVSSPIPGLPTAYCRLVYCLGYGESQICTPTSWESQNKGTPQYWDLFATLAEAAAGITLGPYDVRSKITILERLRSAGIWLVDACVTGVYDPASGSNRLGNAYQQIVRDSYRRFVASVVRDADPELVCIIGRTVAKTLADRPGLREAMVLTQPNARGLHADYLAEREELCRRINAVVRA